jgi:catechol 2,3-dioxygenase-like lactoylglutathione lyase family enzyme
VFDHVTIRVADRAASEAFYSLLLGEPTSDGDGLTEWHDFSIAQADEEHPPTTGLHVGFVASSTEAVDARWRAAVDAGHESDGKPGPRPAYGPDYYGAFLLDPDGNSAEAVHHDSLRHGGVVDHLWIRVADVAAARAFYTTIAPHAGLWMGTDEPERVQWRGSSGSFSLVSDGDRHTRNLHLAFPGRREDVDAFHEAATAAGHADLGPPGERPEYHQGYYGAYVRAPDGTNVEVVDHG